MRYGTWKRWVLPLAIVLIKQYSDRKIPTVHAGKKTSRSRMVHLNRMYFMPGPLSYSSAHVQSETRPATVVDTKRHPRLGLHLLVVSVYDECD